MKIQLLKLLVCPSCQSDLILNIEEGDSLHVEKGSLNCSKCVAIFPIIKGILRLLHNLKPGVITQSAVYSHYHSLPTKEETFSCEQYKETMLKTLGYAKDSIRNRVILEAGCGIGRHTEALSSLVNEGLVVAMDVSSGIEAAQENLKGKDNCLFVQTDVINPPFRDETFDAVVSWGVIHHTPYPRETFHQLARKLKAPGRLGIFIYELHPVVRHNNWFLLFLAMLRQGLLIRPLRFICSRLPVSIVEGISFICYVVSVLIRFDILGCGSRDKPFNWYNWRRVFIDRFHTRYASEHSFQEVLSWFYEEHFDDICIPSGAPPVTMSGRKGRKNQELMNCRIQKSCL